MDFTQNRRVALDMPGSCSETLLILPALASIQSLVRLGRRQKKWSMLSERIW
jgi:hypothetical protein